REAWHRTQGGESGGGEEDARRNRDERGLNSDAIGESKQAEHDEEADLGDPANAFHKRAGRGAVRQLEIAKNERANIDSRESAGVDERGDSIREHGPDQDREWIEPGRGQCDAAQNLRSKPPKTTTNDNAPH